MPFHRDPPTGRHLRAGARPDTPRARNADGVLALYVGDRELPARAAPADPVPADDESVLRAAHDAALEQVAYLEEQLCSLRAYHAHLLEEERRRMFDERTQMAAELAALREELQRRAYPGAASVWSASSPLAATPDGNGTGSR